MKFFTVNRWNLTKDIVGQVFSFETAEEAERKGRHDEVAYQDQKFERVFQGTYEDFDALKKAS